jgi:hypothetical protein
VKKKPVEVDEEPEPPKKKRTRKVKEVNNWIACDSTPFPYILIPFFSSAFFPF